MQSLEIPPFTKVKIWKLTVTESHMLVCLGFERILRNNDFLAYAGLSSRIMGLTYGTKGTFYEIEQLFFHLLLR